MLKIVEAVHSTVGYEDLDIGPRLRELRLQHRVSLRELGARLGISASALSQIETGKKRPSVTRLHQIVNALGAPLTAVFPPDEAALTTPKPDMGPFLHGEVSLRRRHEAPELNLEGGVTWIRLAPEPIPGVDLIQVTYPPGVGSEEYIRHNGHETAHVLSGALVIEVGFERYALNAGDSISYPSAEPHRIRNTGTIPAVAVWLVLNSSVDS
jgi:transcriptional regulator with XRE-family HTH domain